MKAGSLWAAVLMVALFSPLSVGCDRTDIRDKGAIEILNRSGPVYELALVVPPELENSVYKAMWSCTPQDSAVIRYEENSVLGEGALLYKEDRTATLTFLDARGITVEVHIIHKGQTSPQRFARLEISEHP